MKQTIGIRWQPQSCELKFPWLPLTCSKCCYACHLWTWGISHTVYPFIVCPWKDYHQLRSHILNHKCWLYNCFDNLTHIPQQKCFFEINCIPSRELTYPIKNGILKMIFLFPRWDMLIPCRVYHPEIFPIPQKNHLVKRHHLRLQGCQELLDPKTSSKLQPMVDQDVQRDAVAGHKKRSRRIWI